MQTADQKRSGFFADVATGGTVRDLAFDAASLTGEQPYGVVAAVNHGTITRVTADVEVQSPDGGQGGGLVGVNMGTIAWCATSGSISASGNRSRAGGLVGVNQGTIVHARSSVAVQADAAGGLVYLNDQNGSIALSSASGAVQVGGFHSGRGFALGGFAVLNLGTIDQSFSSGAAQGGEETSAGGFTDENQGTITNSYATGTAGIGKHGTVGGFADFSEGLLNTSYSTGAATRNGRVRKQASRTSYPACSIGYWATPTLAGTTRGCHKPCTGVTGLTTAQFQSGLPAGFDPAVWAQSPSVNNGLPYLLNNPPQ